MPRLKYMNLICKQCFSVQEQTLTIFKMKQSASARSKNYLLDNRFTQKVLRIPMKNISSEFRSWNSVTSSIWGLAIAKG